MKKIKYFLMLMIVFLSFSLINTSIVSAKATIPTLNSQGVAVINAKTGQIIYSKNLNTKYYPASTTKILTALIVLENSDLNEKITISKNPPFADGTKIGIRENEFFTINELLYGLLLESGNDCANALAEHVSGSIDRKSVV